MTEHNCPLCERDVEYSYTSKHHIIPKSQKGKETVRICRDCHRQIHAVFTNKQLKRDYCTIEALRESEQMGKYINWISKRKVGSKVTTKMSNQRKKSSKYS